MRYNYCMFGQRHDGTADKGVLVGYNKRFGAYSCSIYRLREPVQMGASYPKESIESEIFTLCFCDEKSLDGFIKQLKILRGQMRTDYDRQK